MGKIPKLLLTLSFVATAAAARAAHEISLNAGELLEKAALSKLLGGFGAGWFLPFHFSYAWDASEDFQVSADYIYRFDNHGTFDGYHENLLLAGINYRFRPDLIGGLKIGGGKAAGPLSGPTNAYGGGTVEGLYSCSEFAVQISLQKRSQLSEHWDMGLGGGILRVFPLTCQNRIGLSTVGYLVHRVVPIFNWDFIYRF